MLPKVGLLRVGGGSNLTWAEQTTTIGLCQEKTTLFIPSGTFNPIPQSNALQTEDVGTKRTINGARINGTSDSWSRHK